MAEQSKDTAAYERRQREMDEAREHVKALLKEGGAIAWIPRRVSGKIHGNSQVGTPDYEKPYLRDAHIGKTMLTRMEEEIIDRMFPVGALSGHIHHPNGDVTIVVR